MIENNSFFHTIPSKVKTTCLYVSTGGVVQEYHHLCLEIMEPMGIKIESHQAKGW
jgi:hypothetical protein